jgi:hydroxymethylpyrimidine pyrophosphatase-like HAD family hydrolase
MIINLDFDGTIFKEDWPNIGEILPSAKDVINKLYDAGDTIVICTCRENHHRYDAEMALLDHGIKYHYFNENVPERIHQFGNDSRKIGADIYIEDKSPQHLIHGVNWEDIDTMIEIIKIQKNES